MAAINTVQAAFDDARAAAGSCGCVLKVLKANYKKGVKSHEKWETNDPAKFPPNRNEYTFVSVVAKERSRTGDDVKFAQSLRGSGWTYFGGVWVHSLGFKFDKTRKSEQLHPKDAVNDALQQIRDATDRVPESKPEPATIPLASIVKPKAALLDRVWQLRAALMTHPDSARRQYPSRDCRWPIEECRMGRRCNHGRTHGGLDRCRAQQV